MSLRVGIVGATGLVGEELLRVLEERRFPVSGLVPMASARSAGRLVRFHGEQIPVEETSLARLKECDVVFLSAGASVNKHVPLRIGDVFDEQSDIEVHRVAMEIGTRVK